MTTTHNRVIAWLWKLPVCVAVLFAGQVLGLALVSALRLEAPFAAVAANDGTQAVLFAVSAISVTIALASMAYGIAGRWWVRGLILAAFLYGVYGIGNTIEAGVFTTLGGEVALVVMHLPPAILAGLLVALLFAGPSDVPFRQSAEAFLTRWPPTRLIIRLALAVVAFPIVYFLFGMLVAPIVTPYYERLDFLIVPPPLTMLEVVSVRSLLFLLVTLPVIAAWRATRGRLVLALALGHFVALGFAGLVQATFFPSVLRWTHGVEILGGAICYAVALTFLFGPPRARSATEPYRLRERVA